jgi:hypothetical protein
MSLADKLKTAVRSEPGLPCGVGRLLEKLEGEDKEALQIIFSTRSISGTISNRQIHEIIISEGHDVAFASVRLHRLQQCRCYVGKNSPRRRELANGNA